MSKSSINIQPVKAGSEEHNQRLKSYDYVRKELTHLNTSYFKESLFSALSRIKQNYQLNTGQKMQKKATPIREGVVLIKENHTADDLVRLGQKLQERFGIKLIQAYTHKDEGHWREGVWYPNLHGHMVFDWTDEYGRSIKLNRYQMSHMQTLVAEELEMERGVSSDKTHLSAIAFKVQEEEKRLLKLKKELKEFSNLEESELIQYKKNNIKEFLGFKKEIDYPTTLSTYKESLKSTQMEVKEKIKYISRLELMCLNSQKEIESLKDKLYVKDRQIDSLKRNQHNLLTNREHYQNEKHKFIELWVNHLLKEYRERLEQSLKIHIKEHQKMLELDTSYFSSLYQVLKSNLIVEYYSSIQDLKEEVFLKFEEQKQEHSQKVYNKVLEEFKKYQALQEKLQNQQQNKIKKGRRL